jgi:hypothetical protein
MSAWYHRQALAQRVTFQRRSDVELRLGGYVGQFRDDSTQLGESDLTKDKGSNNHEQ